MSGPESGPKSGPEATLVLLRHGESVWNRENRFTGWTDVPLTGLGREQARRAGVRLREAGIVPAVVWTSVLERAIHTFEEARRAAGWGEEVPVRRAWELNERHYGALQGLNKAETERTHGRERTETWRRSFGQRPPLVAEDDPRRPRPEGLYAGIPGERLPRGESLEDTAARVIPCWRDEIAPDLERGPVLVAAHGNSLRALVMHLENLPPEEIERRNIPTGIPLVYRLDGGVPGGKHVVRSREYLAPADELQAGLSTAAHRT